MTQLHSYRIILTQLSDHIGTIMRSY